MRRVIALSASLVLAGCAQGDDDGGNAVPVVDAQPEVVTVDSTLPDAPIETSSDDAAVDAVDSTVADTTSDTTTTDVAVDTEVADTADTAPVDTGTPDTGVDTAPVDAGPPWTHTISIDGTNDFTAASEKLSTTSTGYDAYVTWDATDIYVGYAGPDIGTGASATKWLFVYLDTDPGMSTGPSSAERYNNQAPRLPTGFGAEYYVRWRTDNSSDSAVHAIKRWDGSSWTFATTSLTKSKLGGYVELKIPRALVGGTTQLGLVTFMMNEVAGGEWTYAGLYSGNFVDGYSPSSGPTFMTKYLLIDTGAVPPNATSRIKP